MHEILLGGLPGLFQLAGQLGPLCIDGCHLVIDILFCLPGAALGLKGELLTLGIEAGHLGADGFLKVLGARLEGGVTGLGRALSLIFELVYCLLSLLAKAEVTRGTGR